MLQSVTATKVFHYSCPRVSAIVVCATCISIHFFFLLTCFKIVAPLLAIMLADKADLVVQVVPQALLEFTKTIMQHRFSAVIKKGVMTFTFSRYQSVTSQLFSAFVQAKEKKAVCLTAPTSLKSVFLKVRTLVKLVRRPLVL